MNSSKLKPILATLGGYGSLLIVVVAAILGKLWKLLCKIYIFLILFSITLGILMYIVQQHLKKYPRSPEIVRELYTNNVVMALMLTLLYYYFYEGYMLIYSQNPVQHIARRRSLFLFFL